jgi:hypothetical protein
VTLLEHAAKMQHDPLDEPLAETLGKLKNWCDTYQAIQRDLDRELSKVSRDLRRIKRSLKPDSKMEWVEPIMGPITVPRSRFRRWILDPISVCFDLCKIYIYAIFRYSATWQ